MTKRTLGLAAAAAVLAAAAGYALYWRVASDRAVAAVEDWTAARRAAGWPVETGALSVGGFPSRVAVRAAAPVVSDGGRWRWRLPETTVALRPWAPGRIALSAPGTHRLSVGGREIAVDAARAGAAGGALGDLSARFSGLVARLPDGASVAIAAARLRLRPDGADPGVLRAELALDGVSLPEGAAAPFGPVVDEISAEGSVTAVAALRGAVADWLAGWRGRGGAVRLDALVLSWGALRMEGEGAFALDDDLQPEGAMTARIPDVGKIVQALAASGALDRRAAFAAVLVARTLGRDDGSVRLPVSLQDRRLYLGPAPLLKLGRIEWR